MNINLLVCEKYKPDDLYFTDKLKQIRVPAQNKFIDADRRVLRIVQTHESKAKISFLRGIAHNISLH
jgi:hypothetical protein